MDKEYWTECIACDTETQVLVIESGEQPLFCPMCGTSMDFQVVEEDEDEG
mgnify:CR=1 FL=1